ncbi:MAG: RING finger protein [Planctomycetota bacterium]
MWGPFGLLLDLVFLAGERAEAKQRARTVRGALDAIARGLSGTAWVPWFRKPRIEGRLDGREVQLVYRGQGRFDVRCSARSGTELDVATGWLARLFGGATTAASGPEGEARSLLRRYRGSRLRVRAGRLELRRVRPGLDPQAVLALVREVVQLAGAGSPQRDAPIALAVPVPVPTPRMQIAPVEAPTLRCPFCHDGLEQDALVVHCASCDAPYHPTCFEEADGCAIPGCGGRRAAGGRVQGPDGGRVKG